MLFRVGCTYNIQHAQASTRIASRRSYCPRPSLGCPDGTHHPTPSKLASAHSIQAGWSTLERSLPSVAIACFNRCTLHRLDGGRLTLVGTGKHTPSSLMAESIAGYTVLWADLQENPKAPTLLAVQPLPCALRGACTHTVQVGTSDDRVRIYNAATGAALWVGTAMGTAYGILVRDMLVSPCLANGRGCQLTGLQVLATDSGVHVVCWALPGATRKFLPMALPVSPHSVE